MTHTSHTNSTSTRLYLNLSEINTACPILTLEKIFFEAYYIYYREKKIIIIKKSITERSSLKLPVFFQSIDPVERPKAIT